MDPVIDYTGPLPPLRLPEGLPLLFLTINSLNYRPPAEYPRVFEVIYFTGTVKSAIEEGGLDPSQSGVQCNPLITSLLQMWYQRRITRKEFVDGVRLSWDRRE